MEVQTPLKWNLRTAPTEPVGPHHDVLCRQVAMQDGWPLCTAHMTAAGVEVIAPPRPVSLIVQVHQGMTDLTNFNKPVIQLRAALPRNTTHRLNRGTHCRIQDSLKTEPSKSSLLTNEVVDNCKPRLIELPSHRAECLPPDLLCKPRDRKVSCVAMICLLDKGCVPSVRL